MHTFNRLLCGAAYSLVPFVNRMALGVAAIMRFSQEQKREEQELFQAAISSRAADSGMAVLADPATP